MQAAFITKPGTEPIIHNHKGFVFCRDTREESSYNFELWFLLEEYVHVYIIHEPAGSWTVVGLGGNLHSSPTMDESMDTAIVLAYRFVILEQNRARAKIEAMSDLKSRLALALSH